VLRLQRGRRLRRRRRHRVGPRAGTRTQKALAGNVHAGCVLVKPATRPAKGGLGGGGGPGGQWANGGGGGGGGGTLIPGATRCLLTYILARAAASGSWRLALARAAASGSNAAPAGAGAAAAAAAARTSSGVSCTVANPGRGAAVSHRRLAQHRERGVG
jgi:hypothetical protein